DSLSRTSQGQPRSSFVRCPANGQEKLDRMAYRVVAETENSQDTDRPKTARVLSPLSAGVDSHAGFWGRKGAESARGSAAKGRRRRAFDCACGARRLRKIVACAAVVGYGPNSRDPVSRFLLLELLLCRRFVN